MGTDSINTGNIDTDNANIDNTGTDTVNMAKNKVRKTIKVGKTVKINIGKNSKITKISKKTVTGAKVKENKVIIKGKKAGKSVITVKNGTTTYKITVKVT